jgi:CRISPR-associated protein Cas6
MSNAVVDLVFALDGQAIAEDYADMLWQGLRARLGWLEAETEAGVHPLAGTSPGNGVLYLSKRSRLTLRLSEDRVESARALCGARLDLGGSVTVGIATPRALGETKVLYSHFVELGTADEVAFLAESRRQLDALDVGGELVAGRSHRMRAGDSEFHGFSLMLHGLRGEASMRLQHAGLGNQRKRGCGVFIPHKSVVAVGER